MTGCVILSEAKNLHLGLDTSLRSYSTGAFAQLALL
jgi:hypothetical protein